MNYWQILGIEPTREQREVKRAYARRVKQVNPEEHPEEFQVLREAYESILAGLEREQGSVPVTAVSAGPDREANEASLPARLHGGIELPPIAGKLPRRRRRAPELNPEAAKASSAAAECLNELLDVLAGQGEEAAQERCRGMMKEATLSHLDSRVEFETLLLHSFTHINPLPLALLATIAQLFNWENGVKPLGADSYPDEFNYLMERLHARNRKIDLQRNALRWWTRSGLLARALIGPKRFWWFHLLTLSRINMQMMSNTLSILKFESPATLQYELDENVVAWWERAVSTHRLTARHIVLSALLGTPATIIVVLAMQGAGVIPIRHVPFYLWGSLLSFLPILAFTVYLDKFRHYCNEQLEPALRHWRSRLNARYNYEAGFRYTWIGGVCLLLATAIPLPEGWPLLPIGLAMLAVAFQFGYARTALLLFTGFLLLIPVQRLFGAETLEAFSTQARFTVSLYLMLLIWSFADIAVHRLARLQFKIFMRPQGRSNLYSSLLVVTVLVGVAMLVNY